jgi:hypothetical protein
LLLLLLRLLLVLFLLLCDGVQIGPGGGQLDTVNHVLSYVLSHVLLFLLLFFLLIYTRAEGTKPKLFRLKGQFPEATSLM